MHSYMGVFRNRGRHVKAFSLSPNRVAYIRAGEPYGTNRKAMKRWLRDVRAGRWWDNDD